MNKEFIKKELAEKHKLFTEYIGSLDEVAFMKRENNEKWSAGQQLKHIYLSVRPVKMALLLPKFLLKLLFGRPRQKRTYDELVATYRVVLKNGGKAGSPYIPKSVSFNQRQKLITDLTNLIKSLSDKIDQLSEEDLDSIILPHPLICKTSVREMLYFIIYHVQHHQELVKKYLN